MTQALEAHREGRLRHITVGAAHQGGRAVDACQAMRGTKIVRRLKAIQTQRFPPNMNSWAARSADFVSVGRLDRAWKIVSCNRDR